MNIKKEKILQFFKNNPHIDPESFISYAIDFFTEFYEGIVPPPKAAELEGAPPSAAHGVGSSGSSFLSPTQSHIFIKKKLNQILPSAEIAEIKCGVFHILRENKNPIYFINHVFEENVPYEEIQKFYRELENTNMNGIFLSHNSGICGKDDYQLEFLEHKNIMIYFHAAQNENDFTYKIIHGIEIIDKLSYYFNTNIFDNVETNEIISKETLFLINREIKSAVEQKNNLIHMMEKHLEIEIGELNRINWSRTLIDYLNTKIVVNEPILFENELICNDCGFITVSKKVFANHKKRCCNREIF